MKIIDDDGDSLVTASDDRAMKVWTNIGSANGEYTLVREIFKHSEGFHDIEVSFDQKFVVSQGKGNGHLSVWGIDPDSADYLPAYTVQDCAGGYEDIQCSYDNRKIIAKKVDGPVVLFDLNEATGRFHLSQIINFDSESSSTYFIMQLSQDKNTLAFGTYSGLIHIWLINKNSGDYSEYQTISAHYSTITSMDFSSDHTLLFSGAEDQVVKVWKLDSQDNEYYELLNLKEHTKPILKVRISTDMSWLVSCTKDKIIVWKKTSSKKNVNFVKKQIVFNKDPSKEITTLDICKDNEILAYGTKNGDINVLKFDFENEGFHEIQVLSIHYKAITGLDLSDDHGLLVSSSLDKAIRIWQFNKLVDRYTEIQQFYGHDSAVSGVKISEDLTELYSTSKGPGEQGQIKIWKKDENVFKSDTLRTRLNKVIKQKSKSRK